MSALRPQASTTGGSSGLSQYAVPCQARNKHTTNALDPEAFGGASGYGNFSSNHPFTQPVVVAPL
jgi:hypothetical protein